MYIYNLWFRLVPKQNTNVFSSVVFQGSFNSNNDLKSLISYNKLNTFQFPIGNFSSSYFLKNKTVKPIVLPWLYFLLLLRLAKEWYFTCTFLSASIFILILWVINRRECCFAFSIRRYGCWGLFLRIRWDLSRSVKGIGYQQKGC